ncbi:MAG: hypothetical protein K0Q50_497 [Vampirovibrio sp.]|jgi:hypothetical protein|nr:hypothetical protein [Vampirovibrio sp.]
MLVSSHARAGNQPKPSSAPRFAGDIEFNYYKAKLQKFPAKSIEKMAHVARLEAQEFPEHGGHAQLAKAFGFNDEHIQWFNTIVKQLLNLKKKDKEQAEELWSDLHVALEETFMENGFDASGNKKPEQQKQKELKDQKKPDTADKLDKTA